MPKPEKSDIDSALVRRLAELLEETGLTELEYATDQWRVRVARQPGITPVAVPAPPAPAAATAATPSVAEQLPDASRPGAVLSPMVGTVYLAPEPGAPPFAQVGDQVRQGQTLLIVEAMKVMNPVTAPHGGRLVKVCVENGAPVEFGAALMIIE